MTASSGKIGLEVAYSNFLKYYSLAQEGEIELSDAKDLLGEHIKALRYGNISLDQRHKSRHDYTSY